MTSMRNVGRFVAVVAPAALVLGALAGCSSNDDGGESPASTSPTTPTATAAPPTASPTTTSTSSPTTSSSPPPVASGEACSASGDGPPAGAKTATTIDVDGDGKADQQWVSQAGEFGITTASGRTSSVKPTGFSGGAEPTSLVGDVNGKGEVVMLVAASREANLYRWINCSLEPVQNPQGEQYQFDLTGQNGNGVGCVDIDGVGQLVGLKTGEAAGAMRSGQPVTVQRTTISLDGTHASNGKTVSVTLSGTAAKAATDVTCHDRTLQANGLSLAP
jgi:hypothetical protein